MFIDTFGALCKEKGVTMNKACLEMGISRTATAKWKNGSVPNGQTLGIIAEYFGVTTDYLLGNKKAPAESGKRSVSDDEIKFALWGDCEDMDDEDLADVRRYAAFIRERKKDKK